MTKYVIRSNETGAFFTQHVREKGTISLKMEVVDLFQLDKKKAKVYTSLRAAEEQAKQLRNCRVMRISDAKQEKEKPSFRLPNRWPVKETRSSYIMLCGGKGART